jgi:DNA transformation protein and related proteins
MAGKKQDKRTISQLRNLGPVCEQDLNAAGIFTANELKALGAEAAFLSVLETRKKNGRSAKCCNATYLYALYGAIHNIDWREVPEKQKLEFKQFTAELRASGRFG